MSEKLTREEAEEAKKLADERIREIDLEELIKAGGFYACGCGWRGPETHTQCPGCGDWDTIIQVKL